MAHLMKKRLFLIPALWLLVTGCAASMQDMVIEKDFDERTEAFARAIRWAEYETARDFLHPGAKESPDLSALAQIRVVDVAYGRKDISDKGRKVRQTMTIQFYRKDTLVERTTTAHLLWVFDAKERQWFLESGFPRF